MSMTRLAHLLEDATAPDYVPKYGIGAEQRVNVLKRAAEAGRKFDPRIEAAIVKVDGNYDLASTLEALQYETVEELRAIIKRGEAPGAAVWDKTLADRVKKILAKF